MEKIMTAHEFKKVAINTIEDFHKKQCRFNKPDRPKYLISNQMTTHQSALSGQKNKKKNDNK